MDNEQKPSRLDKLKRFAKTHGPTIGFAIIGGVSAALANYYKGERDVYRRQYENLSDRHGGEDNYCLPIPHELWDRLTSDDTLKVRKTSATVEGHHGTYVQMTTNDEFTEDFEKKFDGLKS